jgi:hypothetical protein
MKHIPAILILVALLALPAPKSPTCQVFTSSGRRTCWCYSGRWVPAPMLACKVRR